MAAEPSGDLLGAHLIAALKSRRRPMEFAGIGGPRMAAEGFVSHFPMEKLSVRGYAEVLRHYGEIMGIRRKLARLSGKLMRYGPSGYPRPATVYRTTHWCCPAPSWRSAISPKP